LLTNTVAEFAEENVWSAETKTGLYNPLTKIPVLLLDDGTALYDSRVIVEYLAAIHPAANLAPNAPLERALTKRWEALGDGIADAGIAVFLERKREPQLQSPDWIARQLSKVESGIAAVSRELGAREHCIGSSLTIADIAVFCALRWLEFRLPELAWQQRYPALAAWAAKLDSLPEFSATKPSV
jgi:glutathione S-transferase